MFFAFSDAGKPITALAVSTASLEDIFLELTSAEKTSDNESEVTDANEDETENTSGEDISSNEEEENNDDSNI